MTIFYRANLLDNLFCALAETLGLLAPPWILSVTDAMSAPLAAAIAAYLGFTTSSTPAPVAAIELSTARMLIIRDLFITTPSEIIF
jgi:hypothetical protein